MKSAHFVYERIQRHLDPFFPAASLDYSQTFWDAFEAFSLDAGLTSQAYIGELARVDRPAIKCVFKISQEENYLVLHEYETIRRVAELVGPAFPHLCRTYGVVKYKSHVNIAHGLWVDDERPFVLRDMLLLEAIPSVGSFYSFAREARDPECVVSLLKQILLSIRFLRAAGCTHFDLHPENILVRACSPRAVLRYRLEGREWTVPTRGFVAVIIDFGFSFARGSESSFGTLACISSGHLSDRFMPYADYVRFIYNFQHDIRLSSDLTLKKMRRLMLRPFHGCARHISKKNGWEKSALEDRVDQLFQLTKEKLILFETMNWVEALKLLDAREGPDGPECIDVFAGEWAKIEERVAQGELLDYLFKYLVQSVHRCAALARPVDAAKSFFLDEFTRLVNSFLPSIDYEIIIKSIWDMAAYTRAFLRRAADERAAELRAVYAALPFTPATCDDYLWELFRPLAVRAPAKPVEYLVEM